MYDYGYGYDNYDYGSAGSAVGGLLIGSAVMWIVSMAVAVFSLIAMWKLFKKAGKPGWAAIVPIYNFIVMIEIAELPMWYIALFFVPFANIYAMFKIYIEIAHKFGKSTGFGVGMVFLNIIFIPMLAFGKSEYKCGVSTPVNNNFNQTPNMPNNNMQFNQSVNMNSQPDIMNVNSNVGSTTMMNVNVSNNGSAFQPVGNVNNNVVEPMNVNEVPNVNVAEPIVPNVQEVNNVVPTNNVVEPMNVNEVPTVNVVEPVVPNVQEVNNVAPINNVVESVVASVNETVINPVNNANTMQKTCPNCGNQVDFSAMFCTNCGHNL